MKKKTLIIIIALGVISLLAVAGYNYVFNAQHRDIASEEAKTFLLAYDIVGQFQANEVLATTTYLDQVLEIKGKVTAIEGEDVVLSSGVQVSLSINDASTIKEGETITIKGRCVGYDELLEVVKIDQSTIIKN